MKLPTSCVNMSEAAQDINDSRRQGAASSYQKTVIRIITIEREFGCGAAGIARELAARLGWKLWDQLLTQEIARFAHCEQSEIRRRQERRDPLYYRLLKSFTLGSYEGTSSVHPVETLDADSIVKTSKRVVEEAAAGAHSLPAKCIRGFSSCSDQHWPGKDGGECEQAQFVERHNSSPSMKIVAFYSMLFVASTKWTKRLPPVAA